MSHWTEFLQTDRLSRNELNVVLAMEEYIDGGREEAHRLAEVQEENRRAENPPEWSVKITFLPPSSEIIAF